jgi:hypothetical protein
MVPPFPYGLCPMAVQKFFVRSLYVAYERSIGTTFFVVFHGADRRSKQHVCK